MKRVNMALGIGFVIALTGLSGWAALYKLVPADKPVVLDKSVTLLQEISKATESIADMASKALVFVSVSKTMALPQGMVDPFDFFGMQRGHEPPRQAGLGSGFFIDLEPGYILTNNHVIEGADEIQLKLANSKTYEGKVIGRDPNTDIAVIQIKDKNFDRTGLASLVLGDSDKIKPGSIVLAVGAPFGLESSTSLGVVSAIGRGSLNLSRLGNFIQTDAAINPGNSGGPLVSVEGKAVGINTAIFSKSGAYNGIGFAVPSNLVREIASSLINNGAVEHGYIGVYFQPLDERWKASLKLPKDVKGMVVSEVQRSGPADKAGLVQLDVIVAIDGKAVLESDELVNVVGLRRPGDKVVVEYYRNGAKKSTTIIIGSVPGARKLAEKGGKSQEAGELFGLTVEGVSDPLQKRYGFRAASGVVVLSVQRASAAANAFLREGDVILSVDQIPVHGVKDFKKLLSSQEERALLLIERAENGQSSHALVLLEKKSH